LLWAWWLALHTLLCAAVLLTGVPWQARLAGVAAVLGHAALRRPRRSPSPILVSANAECAVPDWYAGSRALGARTVVCPYWIRLDLGTGLTRHDILLCADQLGRDEWARLRGLLARRGGISREAVHGSQRPKEPI
jgi:hypothetical protein